MKVIFLDLDGVVNDNSLDGIYVKEQFVKEQFVKELKRVIDVTGSKVVVSSQKRDNALVQGSIHLETSFCYKRYICSLIERGIDIYGYTPFIRTDNIFMERELEIHAYLNAHPEITDFVIIEDDNIICSLVEHQVFIETCDGIKEEHVKPAIDILNGKLGFYPPNYNREETLMERLNRILSDFQLEDASSEVEEIDDLLLKMQREMKDFKY